MVANYMTSGPLGVEDWHELQVESFKAGLQGRARELMWHGFRETKARRDLTSLYEPARLPQEAAGKDSAVSIWRIWP
jgi:hypothetical protein